MNSNLVKLYHHIKDNVSDDLWNFNYWCKDVNECGTVGCALGHCPEIFPSHFKIDRSADYGGYDNKNKFLHVLIEHCNRWSNHGSDILKVAASFFEVPVGDVVDIFTREGYASLSGVSKEMFLNKLAAYITQHRFNLDTKEA